jgi:hypothetical protein
VAEVFDGVDLVAVDENGDADGVVLRVEEVGAVAWRVHPAGVDHGNGWGEGYVFGYGVEAVGGCFGAFQEAGFSGELVRDVLPLGHLPGVSEGGGGEFGVDGEWSGTDLGALLVGGGDEVLLGDVGLAVGGGCCEETDDGELGRPLHSGVNPGSAVLSRIPVGIFRVRCVFWGSWFSFGYVLCPWSAFACYLRV